MAQAVWKGVIEVRVIKRDGRMVEYDRNKILIAIRKANAEVEPFERAADDMIDGIVAGIENLKRDTIQVLSLIHI